MKKRSHPKFLDKMSVNFQNNLQNKLPRAFYIENCVIRITFKNERLSDALNFGFKILSVFSELLFYTFVRN